MIVKRVELLHGLVEHYRMTYGGDRPKAIRSILLDLRDGLDIVDPNERVKYQMRNVTQHDSY